MYSQEFYSTFLHGPTVYPLLIGKKEWVCLIFIEGRPSLMKKYKNKKIQKIVMKRYCLPSFLSFWSCIFGNLLNEFNLLSLMLSLCPYLMLSNMLFPFLSYIKRSDCSFCWYWSIIVDNNSKPACAAPSSCSNSPLL